MSTASRWHGAVRGRAAGGAVILAALVAGGCKSGSSWSAKPSWWTFGGSPAESAALASAPPAPTDVTKPSSMSKPYPTTTTPEGYVLESAKQGGTQVAAAAPTAADRPAVEAAVVTYGSTPPAATPAASAAAPVASAATPSALSSITPQVGPYGVAPQSALGPDQPLPTPSSPAFAAAPPAAPAAASSSFAAPSATPESRFGAPAARVADARAADGWGAPPPAAVPTSSGDSRYAGGGSRFSAIDAAAMTAPPAAAATSFGAAPPATPTELAPPPTAAMPPAVPAPAAAPAALPAAPVAAPAALPSSPAAMPAVAPPTPTRRPDPGYRPGGTSSYRPSRTILAGDSGADGGVRQASFQSDAP